MRLSSAASIVVMLRTLNPQSGVRFPGGARAGNANWQSWRAQNSLCAGSSPAPRTVSGWDVGTPSRALTPALAGSSPAPEALPMRTACGAALVQRTTRFDPGYRL